MILATCECSEESGRDTSEPREALRCKRTRARKYVMIMGARHTKYSNFDKFSYRGDCDESYTSYRGNTGAAKESKVDSNSANAFKVKDVYIVSGTTIQRSRADL